MRHDDNTPQDAPPKFMPGDPVVDVAEPDEEIGAVEFARQDGMICVRWTSGRKEWLHESSLAWEPGFQPTRRR